MQDETNPSAEGSTDATTPLAHERFEAYKRAVDFLALAFALEAEIPRGVRTLADQLRRASLSISLNIAEGTGRTTTRDRNRFYMIARGSALECGAILDACRVLRIGDDATLARGKALLVAVVRILTHVCIRSGAAGR